MAQVFISYSRKDLSFVDRLAADLQNAGLKVWYDVSGIRGGSRWRSEIENALRNSQYVIVVLSPDSIVSEWVEREFLFSSNLKRPIIPLMYRKCEVPLNYLDLNYIDVQGENYVQNFDELLQALNSESTATTLPFHGKQPPFKLKTQYIALLGGGAIVMAAVLGWPRIKEILAPAPVLTAMPSVTQEIESTLLASASSEPSLTPTETLTATATSFPVNTVLVPAGIFTMGADNWDIYERPAHAVDLDAYYIDQYEVTNKQYQACVEAGPCNWPTDVGSATRPTYYGNPEFDDFPVVNVSWDMARAYCSWRGARLPTEAEWEKAARGTDGRTYPWGEGIDCQKSNYKDCVGDTSRVGSYESGKSPYGVYDLAGNVWEWVADWYGERYYGTPNPSDPSGPVTGTMRLIRGGSWTNSEKNIRTTLRNFSEPFKIYNYVGFRCAMDVIQ